MRTSSATSTADRNTIDVDPDAGHMLPGRPAGCVVDASRGLTRAAYGSPPWASSSAAMSILPIWSIAAIARLLASVE